MASFTSSENLAGKPNLSLRERNAKLLLIGRRCLLLFFTLIALFPICWLLLTSFKSPVDATAYPPKFLFTPILSNYIDVFSKRDFLSFFGNSLIVAACSTVFALICGVPAAYSMSRFKFKGSKLFGLWILITYMFPPVVSLIPFFLFFAKFHLLDTLLAIVIMHVTIVIALVTWMMRGFFQDIPVELEEAALVDGCTILSSFFKIVLPITITGIMATAILSFITSWNELLFAITITGAHSKTAPAGIYNFISYREILWGPLAASSMIVLIPVLIFFWFAQDKLIRGMTFGAIK
jgi:multiple sugar transport system permease protein